MAKKKRGQKHKNETTSVKSKEYERPKDPQCLVFSQGSLQKETDTLVSDFRKILQPNSIAWMKKSKIRDIVSVCRPMNFTHMVLFSETEVGIYMKICRLPHGPTLTFKVKSFSNSHDIMSLLKKQPSNATKFLVGPCLMTNLQLEEGEPHLKLSARMFLDMFPTITPNTANTDAIQRCCLIHYDAENEVFDFRHYSIRVIPLGLSKAIKKFSTGKVPNLSKFSDISEFLTKSGMMSESEAEDDPANEVTVNESKGAGEETKASKKSSVRLTELGPRLSVELWKIEEGLMDGLVLYHRIIKKTPEEKLELEKHRERTKQLREQRKREQEKNIKAKMKRLEEHKQKCLKGMRDYKENLANSDDDERDDDAQYFKEEIGEDPDEALFDKVQPGKKRKADVEDRTQKKIKKFQNKKKPGSDSDSDDDDNHYSRGKGKPREGRMSGKGKGKGKGKVSFKSHGKIRKAIPSGKKTKKKNFNKK
ncbi:suppressor of SWI4 1 homolog [Penaeus japonicus]|uniref:suppressor of SWI4 1 homolog n=1 Tax=Penaeus japonicus TaxID=27405 RepID=UPI001C70EEFC|nr:suppressor of SWI4 1 homolog [Penaeus japonicus]